MRFEQVISCGQLKRLGHNRGCVSTPSRGPHAPAAPRERVHQATEPPTKAQGSCPFFPTVQSARNSLLPLLMMSRALPSHTGGKPGCQRGGSTAHRPAGWSYASCMCGTRAVIPASARPARPLAGPAGMPFQPARTFARQQSRATLSSSLPVLSSLHSCWLNLHNIQSQA